MKFFYILVFSFLSIGSLQAEPSKAELSYSVIEPLINLLRSGEIYKASVPKYNEFRKQQGKPALKYEDIEPVFKASAEITEKAYIEEFSNEFSKEELSFLKKVFATNVGKAIFSSLAKSLASGVPEKPNMSQFSPEDKKEFEQAAAENMQLLSQFGLRAKKINVAVQQNVVKQMDENPELKKLQEVFNK